MTRAQDTASSARPARSAARLRRPLDLLQAIVALGGREIASEKLCNALVSDGGDGGGDGADSPAGCRSLGRY
jgi:hypothetical protein